MRARTRIPGWKNSEGRKQGLNLRVSAPGEFFPKAMDKIDVFSDEQIREMLKNPNRPKMRKKVPVIFDQDGVGSCAWEACTQAITTCRAIANQPFVLFNPWFGYGYTNDRDNGSSIDENLRVAMVRGIAPESLHPRSKGWNSNPSDEAVQKALEFKPLEVYDVTNAREFKSALLQRFVVVYGRSGHAITAVELEDFDEICYANSWGNWGDNGFGHERLSRSVNYGYGAWAIRSTTDADPPPYIVVGEETPIIIEPNPGYICV